MVNEQTKIIFERCLRACGMKHDVELVDDEPVYLAIPDEGYNQQFEVHKRPVIVQRKSILHTEHPIQHRVNGYVVSRWVFDPGVRYYPDGSGTPPSWDSAEEAVFTKIDDAIGFIIGFMACARVVNELLCIDMERGDEDYGESKQEP